MKKRAVFFIVLMFIMICNTNAAVADIIYYDVYDHWAADEIYWATNDILIFNGYNDWTFKPDNDITRAEYISILCRAAKLQGIITPNLDTDIEPSVKDNYDNESISDGISDYIDIDEALWAIDEIKMVAEFINNQNKTFKFSNIFPGNKLYPNEPITREEAAVLTSYFISPSIDSSSAEFTDITKEYRFFNEISKLVSNGIIVGYEDKTFRPYNNITRAESATIIKRLYFDMEYLKGKYLQDIQLINDDYSEKYVLFGKYDYSKLSKYDSKYIKAKNTLEYLAFGGYIFPEDEHLYDPKPIETLKQLKESSYKNIVGLNYYLIKFGDLTLEEKEELIDELIDNYITREDINDYESTQIFKESLKYDIEFEKILKGLDKWKESTDDIKADANIRFLKYKAYLKNNRLNELIKIITAEIDFEKNEEIPLSAEGDSEGEMEVDVDIESENNSNEVQEENQDNKISEEEQQDGDTEKTESNEVQEDGEVVVDAFQESEEFMDSSQLEMELDNLEIRIRTIFNRAYILLYAGKFDDAENILRQGWQDLKPDPLYNTFSDKYDKEFIGSIKEVLIRKSLNNDTSEETITKE